MSTKISETILKQYVSEYSPDGDSTKNVDTDI